MTLSEALDELHLSRATFYRRIRSNAEFIARLDMRLNEETGRIHLSRAAVLSFADSRFIQDPLALERSPRAKVLSRRGVAEGESRGARRPGSA